MPRISLLLLIIMTGLPSLTSCVDSLPLDFPGTAAVVVVDGVITDLNEPQVVRLNLSQADPFTGRFSNQPLTGARVELVVDSAITIIFNETAAGKYQGPAGFRGRVGGRYQLRFQLDDGTLYTSSQETMPAVPTIDKITDRYNPSSLPADKEVGTSAASDLFINTLDPGNTPNFYRWDWVLWERQNFCQTCPENFVYVERDANNKLIEGCVLNNGITPLPFPRPRFIDYECRTQCWEILFSNQLNLFADTYTNGQRIGERRIAQIPFYQYSPALVEVRQSALTLNAYTYFKRLDEQTQRTGGLTDTPPIAPVGNIRNLNNDREDVVGYFTASAVATVRYWIDRNKGTSESPFPTGIDLDVVFFRRLNQRTPFKEPVSGIRTRPPLAVCVQSDTRTPIKPQGWRD